MIQKAHEIHTEAEFGQVCGEDGYYDTQIGVRVYAVVHKTDERGRKGLEYWAHNHVFRNDSPAMDRMIDALEAGGNCFNEEHWFNYHSDYLTLNDIEAEWDHYAVRELAEANW